MDASRCTQGPCLNSKGSGDMKDTPEALIRDRSSIEEESEEEDSEECSQSDEEDSEEEVNFDSQKYMAHIERRKVLDKCYTIVKRSNDYGQEDDDVHTEWMVGEWNGYQYKVPMDYHRKVDKMNDRELNRHSKAVKKSIEEEIERQTKIYDLLDSLASQICEFNSSPFFF